MEKVEIIGHYSPQDVIVCVDPGHGTREFTKGKCSPDRIYFEGEWARQMAIHVMDGLRELGFDRRIIVPEREDIPLRERCRRANAVMAANPGKQVVYLSLHTNAAPGGGWSDASGLCVYVSRKASEASRILARNIYDAGDSMGLRGNRNVPEERFWRANYTVITETLMPAVLTESLFHTNRWDVAFLLSENGQETIASMHVAGIARSFGIPYAIKTG